VRFSGQRVVTVYGHQIEIDPQDSLRLLVWNDYEPAEASWYRAVIEPGDTVIEVGAHIGVFTTLFASLAGPSGRVIAFEPDPASAALLRRNVERNGYDVQVHQIATGSAPGRTRFYRNKQNTGDNRLFGDRAEDTGFEVEVARLDDVLTGVDRIDVLKLDVQGAEPLVLAGMSEILRDRPPRRILTEFWPYGITNLGGEARAYLGALLDAGYTLHELDRVTGAELPAEPDDLVRRLTPESQEWANIVAVRG
jgi:FkbM family methyltransferase